MNERAKKRSGAGAFLIELLLGLLIFSLCAAVCVQLFASASLTARQNAHRTTAMRLMQNAAEQLRGGEAPGEIARYYTADGAPAAQAGAVFTLTLTTTACPDGLQETAVTIQNAQETLCSVTVAHSERGGLDA